MNKNRKLAYILSSAATLSPALIGLILWDQLPPQMVTHWGADGNPDGWSSRLFAVIGLPLIMLAIHGLCLYFTGRDPGNREQNPRLMGSTLWLCPLISVLTHGYIYTVALGKTYDMTALLFLLSGLLMLWLGNYMPKCRPNRTVGIRVRWTLANEENWYASHRFAGKLWVGGGILIMACTLLPSPLMIWIACTIFVLPAVIPILYSALYYRQQVKAGTAPAHPTVPTSRIERLFSVMVLILVAAILIFTVVVCVTGDVNIQYESESMYVHADFWDDLTVRYDEIQSVEYRAADDAGTRIHGFGSPRLSMGTFENEEFGVYTRYSYTQNQSCVVLRVSDKILVLSGKTDPETKAIYEMVLRHLS